METSRLTMLELVCTTSMDGFQGSLETTNMNKQSQLKKVVSYLNLLDSSFYKIHFISQSTNLDVFIMA